MSFLHSWISSLSFHQLEEEAQSILERSIATRVKGLVEEASLHNYVAKYWSFSGCPCPLTRLFWLFWLFLVFLSTGSSHLSIPGSPPPTASGGLLCSPEPSAKSCSQSLVPRQRLTSLQAPKYLNIQIPLYAFR